MAVNVIKKPTINNTIPITLFLFSFCSSEYSIVLIIFSSSLSKYLSLCILSPLKISLIVTPNSSLKGFNNDSSGIPLPFSHFDIVLKLTPILSPNCCCVIFFSLRSSAINFPILTWSIINSPF